MVDSSQYMQWPNEVYCAKQMLLNLFMGLGKMELLKVVSMDFKFDLEYSG